jgi:type VI secretion system secreted protein VgrG
MRLIELRCPLLDQSAVALSFVARERLAQEPAYQLDLLSTDPDLDLDAMLGAALSLDIDLGDGAIRSFNTHIVGGHDAGQLSGQYLYTLELGSWLSFLAANRNSRIFQHMTTPQIVEAIFRQHGRQGYRLELEAHYREREYCVQFQETDLNFVKRLLEDEGIYFWIEHARDQHVVVISDTQRFRDLEAPHDILRYLPDGEEFRAIPGREGLQRLQRVRRIRPNGVAVRDFNYHVPSNRLDSDAQAPQPGLANIPLEHYDYGAGHADTEHGEQLARLRLEALQAETQAFTGQANVRALAVAQAFTLEGHSAATRNRRYYVTETELSYVQDGPDSTSQGRNVTAQLRALADDQPYRPLLTTRKPRVAGIQSATVVGPETSEVHTDALGRVRVHFHWDRHTTTEDDASCWIRVSQAWAGKGWGMVTMPRVGQEVLVTYLDGDLDRPLVTGAVYNGDNPLPYDMPKDVRYSGIVSRSVNSAGQLQHASQLTFDDKRGAERVLVHAERDLQQTVERNSSVSIGQHLSQSVKGTSTTYTKHSVKHTGISVAYTRISANFTGVSTRFTKLSTSYTGMSVGFTGKTTSFTGVNTTFAGVSTAFTGVNTTFTGVSTSFTGLNTSITGASNSVTGVSNSMTGISSSLTGVSISATGQSKSMTGVSLSFTGSANSVTGASTSVTGVSTTITGASISTTGSSTSMTGTSVSQTLSSISVTGMSMSSTGASVNMVGSDMSTTGLKIGSTGLSVSRKGASYADQGVDLKTIGMQIKS